MSGALKAAHIDPQFGNDDLSGLLIDTGDRVQLGFSSPSDSQYQRMINLYGI